MKSAQLTTVFASPVATFFAAILLSGALVGANAAEPSDEQESQREKLAKETQKPRYQPHRSFRPEPRNNGEAHRSNCNRFSNHS
jgi:hypothetical protein